MIARAQREEADRRLWTKDEFDRFAELGLFEASGAAWVEGDIVTSGPGLPEARPWTKAEYYRLGDLGLFEGQKAELLEGEIVVTSPMYWPHASGLDGVAEALRAALGPGVWVRTQLPVDLGQATEPEPDVSVVPGSRHSYTGHPTTAMLLVEVSDTTLARDRRRKGSLYARAGISDYWIVNLVDGQLEVYRNPVPDTSQRYGWRYADATILTRADGVAPLAFPAVTIPVADLLP